MEIRDAEDLQNRVDACSSWYHVPRLPFGVTTPGADDMAEHVRSLGFPDALTDLDERFELAHAAVNSNGVRERCSVGSRFPETARSDVTLPLRK